MSRVEYICHVYVCVCVLAQERDLQRIEVLSCNEAKKVKVQCRLESLQQHVTEIQRQKQTISEYLSSNNESVGRVQGAVNAACRADNGGMHPPHTIMLEAIMKNLCFAVL